MDVFDLRDRLITDYSQYIRSFINIADERIAERVAHDLDGGLLWPEPLIQLNPAFEPGPLIDELADRGVLHPTCRKVFRIKSESGQSRPLRLHRHQADALEAAQSGDNYVLTSGTGSGKSLAYIVPIVDHVLRRGSGRGIQAIIVYPMNALANSQQEELEKFLCRGFDQGQQPVTFALYTGQESEERREAILANPPDILLTNYVMLELILTRPRELRLVSAARGLRFIVLDELHTYRGRQGADVAMLVRRVRDACDADRMQCVGTSATLAAGDSFEEQQRCVAETATRLFGAPVKPHRVIGETLRRVTRETSPDDPGFLQDLRDCVQTAAPPTDFLAFINDPLCSWIESTFGLTLEAETGRLRRATPVSIRGEDGAASGLAQLTGVSEDRCAEAIQRYLLAGYQVTHPETQFPVFAFRLHQFISRGDTVYASLEPSDRRHLTTHAQQFVPGDRNRVLLPLAFCRECGQEYYTVTRVNDEKRGVHVYLPRELSDQSAGQGEQAGFLYAHLEHPWPDDEEECCQRVPEDWVEQRADGTLRIRSGYRKRLPLKVRLNGLGEEASSGEEFYFVPAPFAFCLNPDCGVAYSGRERSDFGKLASLSSEGRSTATTVLTLSTIRALRADQALRPEARKLLSFTDNRQDASLQAGHFNDFVEVGLLRAALYQAVKDAGEAGITHEVLALRVFQALNLPLELYALDPGVRYQARKDTERALREVLAYRLYQDLRRGWRVTAPNLEQCGLLEIEYPCLDELCRCQEDWADLHPALADATPETRMEVSRVLLDLMRRGLAIQVDYLDSVYQEQLRQLSSQRLVEPWAIDEGEALVTSSVLFPCPAPSQDREGNKVYVSGRSGFAQYLRRPSTLPHHHERMSAVETELVIRQLLEALRKAGLVHEVDRLGNGEGVPGYQIPAAALLWKVGDGQRPYHDPVRVRRLPEQGQRRNVFFVHFYRDVASTLQGLSAREHTAQVPNEERQVREQRFRTGELPVLYCSPTMELGIDIAQLNAVNMRNVPPTPANYAQRSGRAGRSGQPAIVFTYCTTGSPHDQYFFRRPHRMVSGAVMPPRLDLANEDLVRAHVHSVWLAETQLDLGRSLRDVLDLAGDPPSLELLPSVAAQAASIGARARARERLDRIFATLAADLEGAEWYDEGWLERALVQAPERLDRACDRWRALYRAAKRQQELQNAIVLDHSRSHQDQQQARRLRAEAEAQLDLLTRTEDVYQSDFYSYRYFASEGFLPGYSFPRLPLSAFLPSRRGRRNSRDEFLSRPRFLAISEFGPRSIVYHEGSRYIINRVILPVTDELLTQRAKFCPRCGYLHPQYADDAKDVCEYCDAKLGPPLHALLRLQNVSTRRHDRINCDEEERVRMGYEIRTGLRFSEGPNGPMARQAVAKDSEGNEILRLVYGHAATLWRINMGWRRRRDPEILGFLLDTERGYWEKREGSDDPEDPMSAAKRRVIPFVEDRRNCLLIEPIGRVTTDFMASLQPALKNAIQVLYQLEDNELAAEPLPSADDRRLILIYESAEGGAGVLRRLIDDQGALGEVAREALRLCHFDVENGDDLGGAVREPCEAACYDCLMSYTNQPDHRLLDRRLIRDLLLDLARGMVETSPAVVDRAAHLERLLAACQSDLERHFLRFLEEHDLRLPDAAQELIEDCGTRPDFVYRYEMVAVYVDGPIHDQPDIEAEDRLVEERLMRAGWLPVRFRYGEDWNELVKDH
ncbi:MAG: DEAD/DEAH box helicase, partial [Anaerolineae bacterium]